MQEYRNSSSVRVRMASVRSRATARYRLGFSGSGSCSSRSKYPQIAVSGVRRSWDMFVTACQCLNGSVPGRNGDQRIRVRSQLFIQFLRHLANRAAQRQQIEQQEKNTERKRAGQKNPPKLHRKPLTSSLCAGRMPCPPQSTAAQCPRTPPWTALGASAHGSPAGSPVRSAARPRQTGKTPACRQ